MPNPAVAQLIADRLGPGLPHPGRAATKEKPRLLPLVAFRTAGMPPEMRDMIEDTAVCVGEAIVNLVETDGGCVIMPRAELDELRAAEDMPGDCMPVVCMSCKQTMMILRVVNGRALVQPDLLGRANPTCPHNMEATP
jgi:hypothetical protein